MQLNASETEDGASPSSVFHRGVVRCQLPIINIPFDLSKAQDAREAAAKKMREAAGGVAPKKEFHRGDSVIIQDHQSKRWTGKGIVAEIPREGHQSYLVETDTGIKLWNWKFLRKLVVPADIAWKVTGCEAQVGPGTRSCMKGSRLLSQQESSETGASLGASLDRPRHSSPGSGSSGLSGKGVQFSSQIRVAWVDSSDEEEAGDTVFKENRSRPQHVKKRKDGRQGE